MNPNEALWEEGDFTAMAAFMRESGEAVVESLGVKPPLRALDLGCGDGTTAVPLARLGAEVTGIDIAWNLIAAGNKRATEHGLRRLSFHEVSASDGAAEFVSRFRRFYRPTMNAFDAAEQNGRAEALHSQLLDLAKAHNESTDDGTLIPATFLRVTVCL
jgi:SAM-dependent methyltransferase